MKMASKGSILIVDDEMGSREALRIIFRPMYKVHTACNGVEALDCIRKENIDLVFLDLQMPGLSGFDVLKEIRKINERVAVIVITGLEAASNVRKAIQEGAGGYISKPFNIADIIAVANNTFEQRNSSAKQGHSSPTD